MQGRREEELSDRQNQINYSKDWDALGIAKYHRNVLSVKHPATDSKIQKQPQKLYSAARLKFSLPISSQCWLQDFSLGILLSLSLCLSIATE